MTQHELITPCVQPERVFLGDFHPSAMPEFAGIRIDSSMSEIYSSISRTSLSDQWDLPIDSSGSTHRSVGLTQRSVASTFRSVVIASSSRRDSLNVSRRRLVEWSDSLIGQWPSTCRSIGFTQRPAGSTDRSVELNSRCDAAASSGCAVQSAANASRCFVSRARPTATRPCSITALARAT